MNSDLVSTIVLNWNNRQTIAHCLDSLLKQTYPAQEIILVDNGSTDGSLEEIRKQYEGKIRIITHPVNLGFAAGVNSGIDAAKGRYIALLNSDAYVEEAWLERMVSKMALSDETGMCACKIYLTDRDHILDNTGEVIYRDGLNRPRGRLQKDTGQYDASEDVLCPSGCAALYRRRMLERIGSFDSRYFAYGEDLDVGLRGRLAGYRAVYAPEAIAHHALSGSTGDVSPLKAYYVERNRLWTGIKCFPVRHLIMLPFYTFLRYACILTGLIQSKGPAAKFSRSHNGISLLWILIRTYLSTLANIGYLSKERHRLFQAFRFKSKDVEDIFRKYGLTAKEAALNEVV